MGAHKIAVEWEAIPPADINGQIQGYTIHFTDTQRSVSGKTTLEDGLLQASLVNLKPYTRYMIQVRGNTGAGPGVASPAQYVITDEARAYFIHKLI